MAGSSRPRPPSISGRGLGRRGRLAHVLAAVASIATLALPLTARADEPSAKATAAEADERHAIVLPTHVVSHDEAPRARADRELEGAAQELDGLLSDTAQDLGLAVDLAKPAPSAREPELAAEADAAHATVIAPSVERVGAGQIEIRIEMVSPGSRVLHLRVERAAPEDVSVRAAVMLRDLVQESAPRPAARGPEPAMAAAGSLATPARSAGRGVLAANATLYGGLVGFSLQKASGSDDPRLLYPLLAVGAGIGLGGSLVVAEEWDVGVGDAWYLSAGAWWPTVAGHLIYEGRFRAQAAGTDERWAFGLVGGATGVTLATLALTLHGMSEGNAVLAHSGGGLGLVFGGLADLAVRGDVHQTPFTGMGYGAGIGWLAAAALATQVHVPASRVLAVDLGALLGGLGGAALASPLLFGTKTVAKDRGWLGATAGASLLGGGIAWFATRDGGGGHGGPLLRTRFAEAGLPSPGLLGESVAGNERAPILGVSWQGTLLR